MDERIDPIMIPTPDWTTTAERCQRYVTKQLSALLSSKLLRRHIADGRYVTGAPLTRPIDAWIEQMGLVCAILGPTGAAIKYLQNAESKTGVPRIFGQAAIGTLLLEAHTFLWKNQCLDMMQSMPVSMGASLQPVVGAAYHSFEDRLIVQRSIDGKMDGEKLELDGVLILCGEVVEALPPPLPPGTDDARGITALGFGSRDGRVETQFILPMPPLLERIDVTSRMVLFLETRVPKMERYTPKSKSVRKQFLRHPGPTPQIAVIRLRHYDGEPDEVSRGTGEPLTYRQLVSGHWKRVHTRRGPEARWINQYWRGPEDGPTRRQVRHVVR